MVSIRGSSRAGRLLSAWLLLTNTFAYGAYNLDVNSKDSVLSTAKQLAADMMSYYNGDKPGGTPGLLPPPYYWWECGAMFDGLINYWVTTKDSTYNAAVSQGLLYQVGNNKDYMPLNQTRTEGNDDQGFWGLAVMSAAEYNFPNPPPDQPQWLALAQAVFNLQASRWDTEHCGGGLRWQIFRFNNGFDYKNSISQACFFALGARLAVYTGNSSYAEWAEKTWDWTAATKLINPENWFVYDGAYIPDCNSITPYQFSYNAAGFILGAAAMYNHTEDPKWKNRLDNLLEGAKVFFQGEKSNIMTEVACEPVDLCNLDQQSFKAYMSRWFAAITKWAPHTYDIVMPLLRSSAVAATKQCVGGANGRMCGLKWSNGSYDGSTGVGQQMAAMEVTLSLIVKDRPSPFTAQNGGTSIGDAGAGGDDFGRDMPLPVYGPLPKGHAAAGAFITLFIIIGWVTGVAWLLMNEKSDKTMVQQAHKAFVKGTALGATMIGKGKPAEKTEEKNGSGPNSISDQNSRISDQAIEEMPVRIGHVRNTSGNVQRRMSNMPLGWPRNSVVNPGSETDISAAGQQGPSSAIGKTVSNADDEITPVSEPGVAK